MLRIPPAKEREAGMAGSGEEEAEMAAGQGKGAGGGRFSKWA